MNSQPTQPPNQDRALPKWTRHAMALRQMLGLCLGIPCWIQAQPIADPDHGWEPLGQSSRLTGIVISEIHYHPRSRTDGRQLEFVELHNPQGTPQDLSRYRLSGDVDFEFPAGTVLPAHGFLVVARNPTDLQVVHGISGVFGPFEGGRGLPNAAGLVRLRNRQGAVLLEVPYASDPPWPSMADGWGLSLVLARPSLGEANPLAWTAGTTPDGSPGRAEIFPSTPLRHLVINEILAHTDDPQPDVLELHNRGDTLLDLSGCVLTDDPLVDRFVIPQGTTLPAGGFLVYDQQTLGFGLDAAGETLALKSPGGQVLDAIRFGPQENGVAYGRSPDGVGDWYRLASLTPAAPNARILVSDVVINEIMYHPISGEDGDQYLELHNRGTATLSLDDWELQGGIGFTFPRGTRLGGGGFLVVSRNASRLRSRHAHLNATNCLGDFAGRLSRSGESVILAKPEELVATNAQGQATTNRVLVAVDQVTYADGGRWGVWSDGGGSSLEKIEASADGRLAAHWADSDESRKAPWTLVETTGRLDLGNVAADQLQFLLQGAGECLVDDVEVLNSAGANLVANGTFEDGASGWTSQGTQSRSGWEESEGHESARSYRVRAVERGDNQLNRTRTPLRQTVPAGSTATLRARVRWLKGFPEALLRFRGNWLEAVASMEVPGNLGTPAAPNSRSVANAAPAIHGTTHEPTLPPANTPVTVRCRVSDLDGIASVELRYRIDPATDLRSVPMRESVSGGSASSGAGVFSAVIPAQPAGTLVAFHVVARDAHGNEALFPPAAAAGECLVRFGETIPTGDFPVYRIWMTRATLDEWTRRDKLNNTPLDITFVTGSQRAIYNARALYAGSPYIAPGYSSPVSGRCGYSLMFPSDDRFLGDTDLVLDWPGGHDGEQTGIQEQMAYWLAEQMELPYSHRYHIRLFVNGVSDMQRRAVFEAVNQPASDFVEAWMPDDPEGPFYKIDRAFEFSDGGSLVADPMPRLQNYTTTGGQKKMARYRWNWLPRAGTPPNDYRDLFSLVDALNAASPEPYTSATEALVDVDEWMGIFALEHIIVNFDAYGHEIGKNMYAFKPASGRWQLYMFDLDWLMLAAAQRGSGYAPGTAGLFNSEDPTITRMYNHPPFRRAYFRAVKRAVDGPMQAAICDPVMDARHRALVDNGITYCDGQPLIPPGVVKTWFSQRRAYLVRQLQQATADFAITTGDGADFSTDLGIVELSGTAPLDVEHLLASGTAVTVRWTTLTTWSINVPLQTGPNVLVIEGRDGAGNLVATDRITVTTSQGASPPRVVINEWMAANRSTLADPADGDFDDWFELFNAGTVPVDLSNWSLSDTRSDVGARWRIPAGTLLAPAAHLLVWADNETGQNAAGSGLHAAFRLSQDGDSIALFDAGGVLVDAIEFGPQQPDVSEGRSPDGADVVRTLELASPGSANPGAHRIVLEASPSPAGGVILSWNARPGTEYRVQETERLVAPTWNLVRSVQAAGTNVSVTLLPTGAAHRFFRVAAGGN